MPFILYDHFFFFFYLWIEQNGLIILTALGLCVVRGLWNLIILYLFASTAYGRFVILLRVNSVGDKFPNDTEVSWKYVPQMTLNFTNKNAFTMHMKECVEVEELSISVEVPTLNTVWNIRGNQQFEAAKNFIHEFLHRPEVETLLDFVVSFWKMLICYHRQTWHSSHHINPIDTIKLIRNSCKIFRKWIASSTINE